jgi:small subunit ribosomal protein S16
MPVKIRLSRKGKKGMPFYHIVVADSRAPRDGRFIEKLGIYNPNTQPATIDLNFDKALQWLQNGAQPTETARGILSVKGVMLKKHLLEGAKKGAFSTEEAETRFSAWLEKKEAEIISLKDNLKKTAENDYKKRLADEVKVKEARAAEILKRQSEIAAAEKAANEPEVAEVTASAEEVTESAPEEVAAPENETPATE